MICPAQPSLSGEVIIIDEEDDDCESIGHTPESQPDRYSDLTQVIRRASLETVLSLPQAQYPDTHLRIAHSLTSRGESPEPIFRPETTRRAKDKMSSDRTRVNSGNAPKRKRSPKASPSPSIFELDSHSTVNGRRSDWSPDTLSGNESDNELAEEVENLYLVPLDDASPDTDGSSHHKFLAGDFLSDAAIEDRFSRGSQTNSSQERGAPKKYRRRNPTFIPVRNVPVGPEVQAILLCSYNDINLSPGTTVELIDGTFVRLQRILRNRVTGVVNLRGWIFRRNSDDQTPLAPVLNEVYWVNDIDRDDPRPFRRQCVEEFSVGQVVRARKLIITNNADVNSENQSTGTMVNDDMTLICRVRALRIWKTAKERMGDKYCERAFVYVMSSEADAGPDAGPLRFRLRDDVVRSKFRGETILGGSAIGMSVAEKERRDYEDRKREEARTQRIDLEEEDTITLDRDGISSPSPDDDDDYSESEDVVEIHQIETMPARAHHSNNADPLWRATARAAMPKSSFNPQHQNYSYADAFAGAGGTTRGAVAAGARVRWALDFNEEACRSYAKSFPWVRIANCDAYHFVTNDLAYEPRYVRVDILHLSPPCQVFSPAHTTEGINDAANYAASLSIWWFLRKVKPRIATLENTFGLQQRHPVWLRAILNQFTSEGYSVRYMILHFKDYGLPTIRKRLIIIAACPGEALPEFPEHTHAKNPAGTGLKRYNYIHDAIKGIPWLWQYHDPSLVELDVPVATYPAKTTQAKTITTGGTGQKHPGGLRNFTPRELASIQGFHLEHEFGDGLKLGAIRKQIGNSVPPRFGEVLFKHIIKGLRRADGFDDADPGSSFSSPFDLDNPTPAGHPITQRRTGGSPAVAIPRSLPMRPSPRPLESFANARTTSPGSQTRRLARAPRMIAHTQRRHAIHIPIAGKDKVYDIEDN